MTAHAADGVHGAPDNLVGPEPITAQIVLVAVHGFHRRRDTRCQGSCVGWGNMSLLRFLSVGVVPWRAVVDHGHVPAYLETQSPHHPLLRARWLRGHRSGEGRGTARRSPSCSGRPGNPPDEAGHGDRNGALGACVLAFSRSWRHRDREERCQLRSGS